jgi:hypothetical protein
LILATCSKTEKLIGTQQKEVVQLRWMKKFPKYNLEKSDETLAKTIKIIKI